MKKEIKLQGIIKIGSKVSIFPQLGNDMFDLVNKIKEAGLSLSHLLTTKEVEVDVSKQRGRPAAKY